MTDPCAEAIVDHRVEYCDLRAQFFNTVHKFVGQPGMNVLAWQRCEQPRRTFEQVGIGEIHSRLLFTCHGMSGEKALAGAFAERLGCSLDDFRLGTATSVTSVRGARAGPRRSM